MSDIVEFPGGPRTPEGEPVTTERVDPEKVLQYGLDSNMKEVIVLGWGHDDTMKLALSSGSTAENVLLLETAKNLLVQGLID